jgi:hypothetical protein
MLHGSSPVGGPDASARLSQLGRQADYGNLWKIMPTRLWAFMNFYVEVAAGICRVAPTYKASLAKRNNALASST